VCVTPSSEKSYKDILMHRHMIYKIKDAEAILHEDKNPHNANLR
jgi:hypothetical protein